MSSFRENLIDRMIRLYGFEHKLVIEFVKMCEEWEENGWNNTSLAILVASHEESPVFDEE